MNMKEIKTEPLKLDFNERADRFPSWLDMSKLSPQNYWRYPDQTELKLEMSNQLGLQPEQVMVSNGGDEAIELMFKVACLEQKELIIPMPAFSQYLSGIKIWNSKAQLIPAQENQSIDLEASLNALTDKSILVLTSPNNPTGETLSLDVIRDVCKRAKKKGAEVFLDQAYIEFTGQAEESLSLLEEFDNLIVLRTLSKAYGLAGIRCGYLLGNQSFIKRFTDRKMPFNVPQPTLEIARQAFSSEAQNDVADFCQQIANNRDQLVQFLRQRGLNVLDSEANFILIVDAPERLQLIKAACELNNIQIKTDLVGLDLQDQSAIRIAIPYDFEPLRQALFLALKPELICFDMDGVLIDTSKSYDAAIKQTVEFFIGTQPQQQAIDTLRSRGGFNNDWVLTYELIKQNMDDSLPDYEQIVEQFQTLYLGSDNDEGLNQLEEAILTSELCTQIFVQNSKQFKTAIVTGRPRAEAQIGLDLLGIRNTYLVSDCDVIESKPAPEGINQCKAYYGATYCWMLGDTPDDIQAAKAAGALAIGVSSKENEQNLYQAGADLVVASVNDLERLL
ncbi:aminotransferase class I/II-fold pyridoxal phosphate-dependent enzyme [Kangiella koreensis]|uniref:histidinol-phosphate transaminase n=1 Tax=Kangiella koreensis (strain DSM 16069 / JCM 12317 / KCTC 12182 / SW-125) TaxID=523791 RepID=C7RAI3_KANKD|nr:aminotransferase class I/II-fold pyridoxal phosphate-dependent enzyme [Kangiella koreensis]ACV26275.1 HAD-superfamily hydrolase, subfamily IA, variant 1 [Kangiella koreensis DSM 16069]